MWLAVLANVLWAGTYVAGKVAEEQLSTIELNFLRILIASVIMGPIVWLQRDRLHLNRQDWLLLSLIALAEVLNKFFQFYGLTLTSATNAALLVTSESMFIAVLAWLILRERLTAPIVAGLLIGFAGVYIVVEGGLSAPRFSGIAGELLILLAIFVEAFYTIIGKDLLRRRDPLLLTTLVLLLTLAGWLPAAVWDVSAHGWPVLTVSTWAAVLYLAVPATVISYSLWFVLLRNLDAAVIAPTLLLQPFLGALLAGALLRERPSAATLAGGALIMAGVYLAMRSRHRPTAPAPAAALAR